MNAFYANRPPQFAQAEQRLDRAFGQGFFMVSHRRFDPRSTGVFVIMLGELQVGRQLSRPDLHDCERMLAKLNGTRPPDFGPAKQRYGRNYADTRSYYQIADASGAGRRGRKRRDANRALDEVIS
ncbi:MAG TPA: hypothetical protein VN667_09200 [Burkholderiales bacterium]|nr:hypothetical protein [Burkholderiales bacterium]